MQIGIDFNPSRILVISLGLLRLMECECLKNSDKDVN